MGEKREVENSELKLAESSELESNLNEIKEDSVSEDTSQEDESISEVVQDPEKSDKDLDDSEGLEESIEPEEEKNSKEKDPKDNSMDEKILENNLHEDLSNLTHEELKNRVEAILFAYGKMVPVEEIMEICKSDKRKVNNALDSLKQDYLERGGAVELFNDGPAWKLNIREKYLPFIQRIVVETELNKSVLETLAVIAFKHPILQADLIKIRTNKAYDHLRELEERGYISREMFGRTKKIKLTEKFFEYFDLPPNKLRDAFSRYEAIEEVIMDKEKEAKKLKQEMKDRQDAAVEEIEKQKAEAEAEVAELPQLEVFDEPEEVEQSDESNEKDSDDPNSEEKLGDLEVYEEKSQKSKSKEPEKIPEHEDLNEEDAFKDAKGIEETPEVDKRADEIIKAEENVEAPDSEDELLNKAAQEIEDLKNKKEE